MNNRDQEYVRIVPTKRQIKHQQMEFYAFFHFSINTFTNKEWGEGMDDPSLFNPTKMDASQWAKAIKAAGMKGAILTCKHHDGFCLWPSKYTKYSITASPYKDGKGDIVKEVSDALRLEGLEFGIYLSPWDRNNEAYGQGLAYNDYFVHQLEELLTGYGELFAVWFDGACGENSEGKRQSYDWERYYEVIRRLQPNACISICGEDVRWCGNEAGDTRESEWSVVPRSLSDAEKVSAVSQKQDEAEFRKQGLKSWDLDLGSREKLAKEEDLIWYPSEVDTSIRPGWFYHESEDDQVRSLKDLIYIYEHSVGGNATLLLNIPPTKEGLLHRNDVNRLKELGEYIKSTYAKNKALVAEIVAKTVSKQHKVIWDEQSLLYATKEGETSLDVIFSWKEKQKVSKVVLMEQIEQSQRIEEFSILAKTTKGYQTMFHGTTVGYKKIASFPTIETEEVVVKILDSRVNIQLQLIGIYE